MGSEFYPPVTRTALTRGPQKAKPADRPPPALACLQHRVDGLRLGARVRLHPDVRDACIEALAAAEKHGATELRTGGYEWSVKRTSARDALVFQNADLRGQVVLTHATSAGAEEQLTPWTMTVDVAGGHLARHTFGVVVAGVLDVLSAWGVVEETMVRRIDLAADFGAWDIREQDAWNFKRPSGPAQVVEWAELDDTATRFHRGTKLTGVTICPGGDLMLRIYDKIEELRIRRDEQKTATEHEVWTWAGWRPGDAVTRVEFQFRSQVLKEFQGFNGRNIHELAKNLDALWRYATERWCALLIRDDERTSRCSIDPRWLAVQAVLFEERQVLPRRHRKRNGACAGQAIGACLSIAASGGLVNTDFSRVLSVPSEIDAWRRIPEKDRPTMVRRCIWLDVHQGLRAAIDEWVEDQGDPMDAIATWTHRRRAAVARFAHLPPTAALSEHAA